MRRSAIPIILFTMSVLAGPVNCQETADEIKMQYRAFVEQKIQQGVFAQLSAPALVRAEAFSQFAGLPPQDRMRLLLACKGAASAVAERYRVPAAILDRVPWERHKKFMLNGHEVNFPESFRRVESKRQVNPATVVITTLSTSIQVNVQYERTGVGSGGSGGINGVFLHEIYINTLNNVARPQQIAEFEVYRMKQMQQSMSDFLVAILSTELTLNDEQRKLAREWYLDQLDDVAANPDNPIGQNTSFALKRLDDESLEKILSIDQWVIWKTKRTTLEQRRW
ncbi:MAG: hypothetical protein ABGX07_16565 [Pirellulaceae bacterium]